MKKLKAAIIGIGQQAIEDHIPGLQNSDTADLVAICDSKKEILSHWKNKLGVKGYLDCKELLSSENLDFIIISTPHNQHKKIIEEAIKKKVSILKEKPFAMNYNEAKKIDELCKKNKIHLMTTLQRRFNPIYNNFFQLIDKIGSPFFIDIRYSLFINDPHSGWRGDKSKSGGGCILDMGYHMIDLLIWYFGVPDKVHAEMSAKAKPFEDYNAEDTASIMFKYQNGLYGSMRLSRYYPPKTEYFRIIGTKGILQIKRGVISRLNSNGEIIESLTRENSWPSAATDQIEYFCKVIWNEKKNLGDPKYHLQHMAFIEACYKSKEKGEYINIKSILK